jgi:ribonuclease P protein component
MLPAAKRINRKEDFAKIQRYGQYFQKDGLNLQCLENKMEKIRIGFVVGIKFSKKAVERNALKRKLREIMQQQLGQIKPGVDIIVSAKGKTSGKENSTALKKTIIELLQKSGRLKNKSEK